MSGLLLLFVITSLSSFGQEYGLEFAGKPSLKDNRTKLELNPGGYFTFNDEFGVSFSIQIRETQPATFGYIARIIDANGQNIDIIFSGPESHSLHVVFGSSLTSISIPDNDPGIYEKWAELRLRYDNKDNTFRFSTADTSIHMQDVHLSSRVKIFFGRNDFGPIQTTDVPRMNLKDIRIFLDGKCQHHYPLDELTGNEAQDILANKKAVVQNPGWIKPGYLNWDLSYNTSLSGLAAVCYEPGAERIFIVGDTQMKIYSVLDDTAVNIVYRSTFEDLLCGSQVFFDTVSNRLIYYNLKIRNVQYFNFSESTWEEISDGPNRAERFWFHNRYYSAHDSILYVFGGYSQHRYSNLIQQYDLRDRQWDTIQPKGEVFYPRMHAAIGSYADTLFIIGGFGSRTGDQIIKSGALHRPDGL